MNALTATISSILDVTSAQRLAKLCGMFSSRHDGEVINAARMADKLVRERGLSWSQIIAPTPAATFRPSSRESVSASEWRQLAAWVKHNFSRHLNARELQFIAQTTTWRGMPTPKQQDWLHAISERFMEVA